jgi:hypothetical protein
METTRKHVIHAIIVFVVLWAGSELLPQFYHFANLGAVALGTAAYMGVYFVFNLAFSYFATKVDFDATGFVFVLFMLVDFIPGAVGLFLLSLVYSGFWACTPWLIAIILAVICEILHMIGAFFQER